MLQIYFTFIFASHLILSSKLLNEWTCVYKMLLTKFRGELVNAFVARKCKCELIPVTKMHMNTDVKNYVFPVYLSTELLKKPAVNQFCFPHFVGRSSK